MQQLIENIISLYREKGVTWLSNLSKTVDTLAEHWQLSSIQPVDNMTYNYVAKAFHKQHKAVILKVSCDSKTMLEEKKALDFFEGHASIAVIDSCDQYRALLLEQAVPGITLKTLYCKQKRYVMNCYHQTLTELHAKKMQHQHTFPHIKDWLHAIDQVSADKLPLTLLQEAIHLKEKLLSSTTDQRVLHGDLHHDNILQHGDKWVVIDPKGVIGEALFEMAAFDFLTKNEIDDSSASELFHKRLLALATIAHVDHTRLREWVFVRLILSAVWSIEDGCDPGWAINLAKIINNTQ